MGAVLLAGASDLLLRIVQGPRLSDLLTVEQPWWDDYDEFEANVLEGRLRSRIEANRAWLQSRRAAAARQRLRGRERDDSRPCEQEAWEDGFVVMRIEKDGKPLYLFIR